MTPVPRLGRTLYLASLALVVACSTIEGDPRNVSVLYSNHYPNTPPGPATAVITWLSPGTATGVESFMHPCPKSATCSFQWYKPGFRTDTVRPNEERCVHFMAPSEDVAVEVRWTWPDGAGGMKLAGDPTPTWSTDSAWGFDGQDIEPAGTTANNPVRIVQGC